MADNNTHMTTIGNRPAKVGTITTINGIYVQCRLPSGEDAYVPLSVVYELFEKEMLENVRVKNP